MSDYLNCPGCDKRLKRTTTKPERYRKHGTCDFGGTVIPEEEQCQSPSTPTATSPTATSVTPSDGGGSDAAPTVTPATTSTEPSPSSPGEAADASACPATAPDAETGEPESSGELPGVRQYGQSLNDLATEQLAAYRARVEANLTPFSQPTPHDYERPTLFSQPAEVVPTAPSPVATDQPAGVNQCGSGPQSASPPVASFAQPAGRKSEEPPLPMTPEAGEIAARLKELFYAYDNRRSEDNRSAQVTMGPSEMGTPCDRRLALSIMRMPPVNPGGDGWAAFVGTCIHAGLEQMFMWADAGTGRFAVEQRLEFGHAIVPKGTADLIDRTLLMVLDHKCQGRWSRNKLKTQGPTPTYRVQAHVYAHGARLRGEKIEKIAIVSWPRDEASLDDLYVHVEDYNPGIVKTAFERVDSVYADAKAKAKELRETYSVDPDVELPLEVKARVAADFNVADDCRFCKYYMPNARDITRGCNGKR